MQYLFVILTCLASAGAWAQASAETSTPPETTGSGHSATTDDAPAERTQGEALSSKRVEPVEQTPAQLAPWAREFNGRVTTESPHYDLEVLYFEQAYDQGLAEALRRIEATPTDVVPYWMAARFLYEIGERFARDDTSIDKVAHYRKMIEVSEQGLEIDGDNPHLWFARGIGYGRLGTTRGVLASLFMAQDVEESWTRTADSELRYAAIGDNEYLPCDAHQALAVYYRLVPDWWIVKVIAGTRGDLDKALQHAQTAVTCAPRVLRTEKELGVIQTCLGSRNKDPSMVEQGTSTLRAALSIPARKETDHIDLKHIQMLIDDPSLACEYSRDGQQDLDQKKLER